MATISALDRSGSSHPSRATANVKVPYRVEFVLDFADALTAKGSALAAADVIEVITIPAGTVVLGAGIQLIDAANSTTLTLDVGTGTDADEWVDGFDAQGGTEGAYGTDLSASPVWNTYGSADTIDVTLATLTGTLTTGKVRVYALMLDVSGTPGNPGIAALKS